MPRPPKEARTVLRGAEKATTVVKGVITIGTIAIETC